MDCVKNIIIFFGKIIQSIVSMGDDPANEIIPRLWLGNRQASQNEFWLRQNDITVVFNATKDIPFVSGIPSMYRVPVDDNLQEDEIRNMGLWSWEIVFKVIKEYKQRKTILIHCAAGMQRSAAIVAMVLIAMFRCSTDEAIAYIKKKRSIAFYGQANFYKSIKGFEKSFFDMIVKEKQYSKYPKLPLPP